MTEISINGFSLWFRGTNLPVREIVAALDWDIIVIRNAERKRVSLESDEPKAYCPLAYPYEIPPSADLSLSLDHIFQTALSPIRQSLFELLDHPDILEVKVSVVPYVYGFTTQRIRAETWQLMAHPKVGLNLDVYFPIAEEETFKHAGERTVWFGGGFNYEERFETSEQVDLQSLKQIIERMPSSGGADEIHRLFQDSQLPGKHLSYKYLVSISKKFNSGAELSSDEILYWADPSHTVQFIYSYWNPASASDVASA